MFRFDTHMHFDLYENRRGILEYVEDNKSYTIAVTNLPELYEKYRGMDYGYKYVNIALGFHPELAAEYCNQINVFERNVENARYIGEVGIDYTSTDKKDRIKQREVFEAIVSMSKQKNDKIVTVHSRRAEREVLDITKDFPGTIILHWFSGSLSLLNRAIEEEKYFSINHQMLKSSEGRKLIDNMPLDRILIESDAPFTSGLKAEYSLEFIKDIYDEMSIIKRISIEELQLIFRDNFKRILTKNR